MRGMKGEKVGIVCCSNPRAFSEKPDILRLCDTLSSMGMIPCPGPYLYGGTAQERGESLMDFYRDPEIRRIFDISGGDMANEILPYLDFEEIASSKKLFWGYSDLTVILNAILARTRCCSVLYQIRNLLGPFGEKQRRDFSLDAPLFDFQVRFIRGSHMKGIMAGGNIRCLLKLAGTPYWPDMQGKILFLESWHGLVPQMITFLSQLSQMGVFDQVSGILLGTFTQMQEESASPSIEDLVCSFAGNLPVAKTEQIGHGADSKALMIGQEMEF